MPTVDQYKQMLQRANDAGDTAAQQYFQRQIDAGLQKASAPPQSRSKLGFLDPLAQGLTFGFADELAGGIAGAAEKVTGGDFWPTYYGTKRAVEGAADDYTRDNPIKGLAAEIGGGLAFPLGALRSGASGLRTAVKAGAAYGAGKSNTDQDASLTERAGQLAGDAAIGGAAGAAGYGLLKGISALGGVVLPKAASRTQAPSFKKNVDLLKREGIPLNVGERIGNKTVRQDSNMLARALGQSDPIEMRDATLMSKLMSRANFDPKDARIGDLSRDAVENAAKRFSSGYDKALRNVSVRMPSIDRPLQKIETEYSKLLPFEQRASLTRILGDFRDQVAANRTITGPDYKRLRSNLGKLQARASKSEKDNYLAPIYSALKQILDESFRKHAPKKAVDQLRKLDSQYGAYKLLAQAADNPEAIGTLANRARANRGRVDAGFVDLLEAFQDVTLRNGWKSSGTPEGLATLNPISWALPIARTTGAHVTEQLNRLPSGLPLPAQMMPFIAGQQGSDIMGETL